MPSDPAPSYAILVMEGNEDFRPGKVPVSGMSLGYRQDTTDSNPVKGIGLSPRETTLVRVFRWL